MGAARTVSVAQQLIAGLIPLEQALEQLDPLSYEDAMALAQACGVEDLADIARQLAGGRSHALPILERLIELGDSETARPCEQPASDGSGQWSGRIRRASS